jgi:hypothetical protein
MKTVTMLNKIKILIAITIFFPSMSYSQVSFNFHYAYGVGTRYAIVNGPIPLVHTNISIDNYMLFVEAVGSMFIVSLTIGCAYKLNSNSGIHLAGFKGGSIGVDAKGYKIGYIYNSNGYNKKGWETTVELLSITASEQDTYYDNKKSEKYIFPSISFGYHW